MTLEAVYSPEVPSVTVEHSAEDLVANFEAAREALRRAIQQASDAEIAYRASQEAALYASAQRSAAYGHYIDTKERLRAATGLSDEDRARLAQELQSRAVFYDDLHRDS